MCLQATRFSSSPLSCFQSRAACTAHTARLHDPPTTPSHWRLWPRGPPHVQGYWATALGPSHATPSSPRSANPRLSDFSPSISRAADPQVPSLGPSDVKLSDPNQSALEVSVTWRTPNTTPGYPCHGPTARRRPSFQAKAHSDSCKCRQVLQSSYVVVHIMSRYCRQH